MLKSYKNKLLLELKSRNIDLNKFKIETIKINREELDNPFCIQPLETIRQATVEGIEFSLKNSPLNFFLCNSDNSFDLFTIKYNNFIPGFNSNIIENLSFEMALNSFYEWSENDVTSFLEELAEPDLWSAFIKEKFDVINFNTEKENFTTQEKENIVNIIEGFKKDIFEKIDINSIKLNKINEK